MHNEAQSSMGNRQQRGSDELWQYVQSLSPEIITHMSQPQSQEVHQVMERNIIGLLGALSGGDGLNISINMSREHLGRLLGSAMMGGYFLRNAEQRLTIEKSLQDVDLTLLD